MVDKKLQIYLDDFEKDRIQRNHIRDWSYRGLHLKLFPNVFPPDSPYSLTTRSMLDTLEANGRELSRIDSGIVVDVGTGNGSFAVYMAQLAPNARIIAVDTNIAALAAASWNARNIGVKTIDTVGSNIFDTFGDPLRAHLILAALPFAQELRGEGLVEKFWSQAKFHLHFGGRVYFSWVDWVSFPRLERIASREGFEAVRWKEYTLRQRNYKWRVYIFEHAKECTTEK